MKILIYTDVHCSRTSSILPLYLENSQYPTRLDTIIRSFKWMYSVVEKEKVDLIVNLGDLFDKNIVKSEELTAISECYKLSNGIQEYHLVGNHELLDDNKKFYATSILNNYPFIKIFDNPLKIDDTFSVLPYMDYKEISFELLESLKNRILLSHIDILGSSIRTGYDLTVGVDPEFLAMNFMFVANGHIHKHGIVQTSHSDRILLNAGSMTSISFADSNTYIPGITILDTDRLTYKFICNPECILFRKLKVTSVSNLIELFNKFDHKYKYVLCIECPYEMREYINDFMKSDNNSLNCIKYQIRVNVNENTQHILQEQNKSLSDLSSDINSEFIDFIKNNMNLIKYPFDKVSNLIKEVN